MCCCCHEGECCQYGFFAHAFVVCLTAGFALSRDVFECTIPGLSYTSAPGVIHKQFLCCYTTTSWTPAPTVPVNFWCLCNLCLCGFDFGNYRDTSPKPDGKPTIIAAPVPQMVSRQQLEVASRDHYSTAHGQYT
ncbi:unnamed protein product [Calypogeia fissa]